MGKPVIFGVVAGAIGTAIWVAIGYFLEAEVGYVAWGIGFLVGVGVAIGADESIGAATGVVATVIAVLSVVLGKYLVVYFLMHNAMGAVPEFEMSDTNVIASFAREIAEEESLTLNEVADDAPVEAAYPGDVWQRASEKFRQTSPEEVQRIKDERQAAVKEVIGDFEEGMRDAAFKDSFGPFDILWFALAAITAFSVGSGHAGDD